MTIPFYDALRYAVVVFWVIDLALVMATALYYGIALDRRYVASREDRAMVNHVLAIGASYVILSSSSVLVSLNSIGADANAHLWANLAGIFAGFAGLSRVVARARTMARPRSRT